MALLGEPRSSRRASHLRNLSAGVCGSWNQVIDDVVYNASALGRVELKRGATYASHGVAMGATHVSQGLAREGNPGP